MGKKEDPAPETQGTDEEGQPSPTVDLEARIKELEGQTSQLNEQLEKERKLNELLTSDEPGKVSFAERVPSGGGDPRPTTPDYALPLNTFDDSQREELNQVIPLVTQKITSTVLGVMQQAFQAERNSHAFRTKFFSKHPDLQEYEEEVDAEAEALAREVGNRKVDPDKAMSELARRTKARIEANKRKYSTSTQPPHVASGRGVEPETVHEGSARTVLPSEDQRLASYMEEQKKFRAAKMARPLPGGK